MHQMLLLLAAVAAAVSARPQPQELDGDSLRPYQYQYDVNVPETGDQKSHTEERDQAGVVVGNFQVVDPTGDLRKLFYRVEGNSGFVITDQQVMAGFADPPPPPETYNSRQAAQEGSLAAGRDGQQGLGSDGAGPDQSSVGDGGLFGGGDGNLQDGPGGATGSNDFASGVRGDSLSEERGSATGDTDGSSGRGSATDGSPGGASGTDGSSGGTSGTDGSSGGGDGQQGPDGKNSQQVASQAAEKKKVKPFEFHGPAFTFSIQRTQPNRFEVKEKIIGHEVEFNTHGGRSRRSAAGRH